MIFCKKHIILALGLILLYSTSCKKSFSSDRFVEDKLVILSEISANDSIHIPIGKSIRVGNGNLIRFDKINDARVQLQEENGAWLTLNVNYSSQYATNPSSIYTNRRRVRPATTYKIEVQHPILGTVTATTRIPQIPKLVFVDSFYTERKGKHLLALDVNLLGPFDAGSLYVFEALKEMMEIRRYFVFAGARHNYETPQGKALYAQIGGPAVSPLFRDTVSQNKFLRLNLYTDDQNTENSKFDNLENPFRRVFLSDIPSGANAYPARLYVDPQFFTSTDPLQKGRVRIQIKLVSRELFDYFLVYEKYKTDFGIVPASQLVSPNGNISKNGLGIFGGSARRERIYYFDKF